MRVAIVASQPYSRSASDVLNNDVKLAEAHAGLDRAIAGSDRELSTSALGMIPVGLCPGLDKRKIRGRRFYLHLVDTLEKKRKVDKWRILGLIILVR